jgi:hypothetical protein
LGPDPIGSPHLGGDAGRIVVEASLDQAGADEMSRLPPRIAVLAPAESLQRLDFVGREPDVDRSTFHRINPWGVDPMLSLRGLYVARRNITTTWASDGVRSRTWAASPQI